MATRYPSALDDVDNLITVRDNLSSISGDVFNRLRDSILSIERTLGINPQGNFSDLVSRLAVIIAADGSINKQAFLAVGGIFGPIRNADIDPNAQIAESKLNLLFPTSVLQDEIKILDARNAGLLDLIRSSSAGLQEHITRATGAHRATAIATDIQSAAMQSSTATIKIEQANVQLVLQDLYAKHINFSPGINSDLLSLTNSPHQANQIFYDNRNTELATNSVQGAIDNIFLKGNGFITDHQRQLHSNGIQRRIEEVDSTNSSGIARGRTILADFTAILSYADLGGSTNSIFITIPIQQGSSNIGVPLVINNLDGTIESIPLNIDDSLQITDPLSNQYALIPITDLKIQTIADPATNIAADYLVGIDVFYNTDIFSSLFTTNSININNPILSINCSIYKKIDIQGNANGLNCVARILVPDSVAEPNLSSSVSTIQIAHPNAATIISQGFNPSALARRADGYFDRNFSSMLNLVVDTIPYSIQIVPNSPVDITLDNCIAKINIGFLKQNVPVAAYRLGEEMAITHNWPDDIFIAGIKHTIRIVSGGAIDASVAAGFSNIANTTIYGSAGNSFVINGVQRSTMRIKMPQQGTASLGKGSFTIAGNVIIFNDSENNPLTAGVRVGDIVNIQGLSSISVTRNLDGIRQIEELTPTTIKISGDLYPNDIVLSDAATLVIYSNIIALNDIAHRLQTDFAGLDPNLSQNIIAQIYMNSEGEVDYHERILYPNAATVAGIPFGGPSILPITNLSTDDHGVYIVDCSRGLQGSSQGIRRLVLLQFDNNKRVFATFGCQSNPNDGYTLSSSLHGPTVNITGDGFYNLIDETGLNFITIQSIKAFNLLSDTILSTIPNGQLLAYGLPIIKFEQINEFENLLLCNVYYNSGVNQIPLLNGDSVVIDKRYSGTLGAEQIRDDVIAKYVSGPFGETRGDGVVSGLYVPSDPDATQNITNDKIVYVNGGVVYIQGIRYEIPSQQLYVDPSTLDISQYGLDGYFPGTGASPTGNGTFKNGYIKYYVFADHFGKLQTTSKLNLPASLPFVPLAKVVLTTNALINNSPNIISINVVDFRLFINRIDDKIEITVGSLPQQPAHFQSITAAVEYIDNMRYNDVISGSNVHIRPTIIRILEGEYQEASTIDLPPYLTIKGESAHNVRIRPPSNLLNRPIVNNPRIDDTINNQFIFNINVLPQGVSAKLNNLCFDLNTSTTPNSPAVPGSGISGGIKITWFNNNSSIINIPQQLINTPSVVDIENCIFLLDGPSKTTGITTVFGSATPLITGGLTRFSYSYSLLFNKIYFGDYYYYKASPNGTPGSNAVPPAPPIPPPNASFSADAFETRPPYNDGSGLPPNVIDTNPPAPFPSADAIFTDPNAPSSYKQGGIMNIKNNTFIITDGFGSICIDRFYDTTLPYGYSGTAPIPISNTRMKAFKITNNSFIYHGMLNNIALPGSTGVINPVIPINTSHIPPASYSVLGQEAARDQIYDLMIHKELRGFIPQTYPDGIIYPDPRDGYGIVDGYIIPPAGGKVTEFMVISNNTPTGLNIAQASPVAFLSETQDSIARDNHGGGTKFGTAAVPTTGLPIVIDRSIDWHDRYIFAYANNLLTDNKDTSHGGKNTLYTGPGPIQNISSGISFYQANIYGLVDPTQRQTVLTGQTVDRVMDQYGTVSSSHGFVYGYGARLSSDLVQIYHPALLQIPGWNNIKYIGTFSFIDNSGSGAYSTANNFALVILPNGALAVLHAGLQDPNNTAGSTKLVQESDAYPAPFTAPSTGDTSRAGAINMTLSFVIQYSPKLNILTTSQYNTDTALDTLDNMGKGFGRI